MYNYDIAIIGMGCVFPGANNVKQYWENILSGDNYISDMPERLWKMDRYYSPDKSQSDKTYTIKGAFIKDFEFPYLKYKYPPNTLKGVDPAQHIALEATREALEDAGIEPRSEILNSAVTILGVSGVDGYAHASAYLRRGNYFEKFSRELEKKGVSEALINKIEDEFRDEVRESHNVQVKQLAVGVVPSAVSSRVAQIFGIKGFNMTVDSACASSFSSLNVACHALMAGDANIAISGGIDLGVNPAIYAGFSRVEGLSLSGNSTPFDHKADGLVIGEGGGVVVLKRLEDALKDGDSIKAVIKGVGATSDGAGQAIYAPSLEGRCETFKKALKISNINPDDVQFIEAHATSTVVGDANEYDAISTVYGNRKPDNPIYLGSVKHQIGHLKAGAGVAGLIKTICAMDAKKIPHMPKFENLTPYANKKNDSLIVPTDILNWNKNSQGNRLAAITSSGFGGSNYHVIIETSDKYTVPKERDTIDRRVAIIGTSCRVPGANSVDTFWDNVTSGKKVFESVVPEELEWHNSFEKGPIDEQIYTKTVGKIDSFKFNSLKFKMFPTSLSQISPTQILGLDLLDQLMEKSNVGFREPKNIGAIVGSLHDDYYPKLSDPLVSDDYAECLKKCPSVAMIDSDVISECIIDTKITISKDSPPVTEHTLPGWMSNIVSGRMANKFNLNGSNMIVDSACSSSLGSLLAASYELLFGNVDMMISGGLNRQLDDVFTIGVSGIKALAENDAMPFDEKGKGFVIGEGGVLFLLKRYKDAVEDGDNILSVIHSIDGSSEADTKSMIAPTQEAVTRAIRSTLEKSHIKPEQIGVVDTHGSANQLSDIIEARSIADEFRQNSTSPVHITAIKSHIGHLYGGSGAASVLSVMQTLNTKKVPGIRNLQNIRPEIQDILDKSLPTKKTIPLDSKYNAGAVTSLGLGGTNFVAIIATEEATKNMDSNVEKEARNSEDENKIENHLYNEGIIDDIALITAKTNEELKAILQKACSDTDLLNTMDTKLKDLAVSITYSDKNELINKMEKSLKLLSGGTGLKPLESQGVFSSNLKERNQKLAFCFPGQGTHYISMGKFLYESNDIFKSIIDQIHELSLNECNFDLIGSIYTCQDESSANKMLATLTGAQISLFAIELGIAKVLESYGVMPNVLIGHSFGEISALTFSGVWDIPTGFKVVKARIDAANIAKNAYSKPMGMMSLICSEEVKTSLLNLVGDKLFLTNINAPNRYILAGDLDTVKFMIEFAQTLELEAKLLPIGFAFHSKLMKPAQESFYNALKVLPTKKLRYSILSTVTGEYINDTSSNSLAKHLAAQLVTPINLPRDINKLYLDGVTSFLEVGPGWSMTKMISIILKGKEFKAVPTLHPKVGDYEIFKRAKAFLLVLEQLKSNEDNDNISKEISLMFWEYLKTNEEEALNTLKEAFKRYEIWSLAKNDTNNIQTSEKNDMSFEEDKNPVSPEEDFSSSSDNKSVAKDPKIWEERVKEKLVEMTGYPIDMLESDLDLEADLGIDSIQRAELWTSLTAQFGLDSQARPIKKVTTITELSNAFYELEKGNMPSTQSVDKSVVENKTEVDSYQENTLVSEETIEDTTNEQVADVSIWEGRVKEKLVEMTGYPIDMLESDLDLEADLGIDSIQRAELWTSLTTQFGLDSQARPTKKVTTITELSNAFYELGKGSISTTQSIDTSIEENSTELDSHQENILVIEKTIENTTNVQVVDVSIWEESVKEKLVEMTGYPIDMLESDLDLEADLGIDSIQRAELWTSLTTQFSLDSQARPTKKVTTITELCEAFYNIEQGATHQQSELSSDEKTEEYSEKKSQDIWQLYTQNWKFVKKSEITNFDCNSVVIVGNLLENYEPIKNVLSKRGIDVNVIDADEFLNEKLDTHMNVFDKADTIIYLAHNNVLNGPENLIKFNQVTMQFFDFFKKLFEILSNSSKRILVPVTQKGIFEDSFENMNFFSSFPTGAIKSLKSEIPNFKFQVITDSTQNVEDIIDKTIKINIDAVEFGIINGAFVKPCISEVKNTLSEDISLTSQDTLLITGGARGIVFECVLALAQKTKCKLILTGRTPISDKYAYEFHNNLKKSNRNLKEIVIALVKEEKLSLKDAKKKAKNLMKASELLDNLERAKKQGISVKYQVCDVCNVEELKNLLQKLKTENISIQGIVHGAGVQKSKQLVDLVKEDILTTLQTKINPMYVFKTDLNWDEIKVFCTFGSIAGLFGNHGQSDYSLANDMLAEMTAQIKYIYPHIKAQTIEWTAWTGTGMVSDSESKRFVESGLIPVDVKSGVELFLKSICSVSHTRVAVFNRDALLASTYDLTNTSINGRGRKGFITEKTIDKNQHECISFSLQEDLFLQQHLVNNSPVVPGTFISSVFSESTFIKNNELYNLSFRRPLIVKDSNFEIEIVKINNKLYTVPANKSGLNEKALTNLSYSSCSIEGDTDLGKPLPSFSKEELELLTDEAKKMDVSFYKYLDDKFGKVLNTGPIFRGIVATKSFNNKYIGLVSLTKDALSEIDNVSGFDFNPILADMAVQVASSWGMQKFYVIAIPYTIDKITLHKKSSKRDAVVLCEEIKITKEESVTNVTVFERDGSPIFTMSRLVLKSISASEAE